VTQVLDIHPTHPQPRLISQVVNTLQQGGVVAYPTDTAYALGCRIGDKEAQARIQQIRNLDKHHNFTLVCQNLSELGTYARVDNSVFRLLKAYTPGAYTFILPASHEVPKRLQNPKRKTIGLRVPDHPVTLAMLAALAEPIMSVSLILPADTMIMSDPEEIYQHLKGKIDLIASCGLLASELTTVIDLVEGTPNVLRVGKGDPKPFL
jgi:tRNA threonylcarbamoyl adenosine modification protein (Sua5/YciO/YrdC/YwlC family)